jgi:PAS domain S-box-containing protein
LATDTGVDVVTTVPSRLRDLGAVAALSVPVGNAEQPLGLLVVGSRQPRVFEAHDVAFARTMAGLLAGALSLDQAGHALRRERDFASGLVETAPVIVTVLDPTGHVEWFNPHLEHLSGRCLEHCWGRDWFDVFIPPREHERARKRFDRSLAGHSRRGTVEALLTRDGHERLIQWHDTVLPDGGGGTRGVLAIGLDVTDRSRAEQELQQRQRLADIGALVTRIVHDVANPLAGLSMLAQRVLRRVERDPAEPVGSVGDAARQMVETARRLERLVGEFKDFAREQRLVLATLDVRRLLEEVGAFWSLEAGARGIDLQVEPIAAPLTLRGDADKLRRVLDNVIKNALEAIDAAPGCVTLAACRTDGNRLRLTVRDTGPGVGAGIAPFSLFETTKPSGTGLGLPVSKQIVLAHGGGITLAADIPTGAVCTIELPLDGPAVG